jgi:two-component system response regulator RegA
MSDKKMTALVVDDDEPFRLRLCRAFEFRGWQAFGAENGQAALAVVRAFAPRLALVDLRLGGESGLDVVRDLRAEAADLAIIVLTGYGSIATALEAIRRGANHYLTKPVDMEQLLDAFAQIRKGSQSPAEPPETVPSLARVEWEHIGRVLADCGGNVSRAAKLLGLHRRSLQRKLAKYPPQL